MITQLDLKNFKCIKKKEFPLRNLNLLFGLNGMGKSTFIQALLLLRQSDRLKHGELKLNGPYANLGSTRDALYQYSKEEDLAIGIQFEKLEKECLEFNYEKESDIFKIKTTVGNIDRPGEDFFKQSLFNDKFQYLNAGRQEPTSIHNKHYTNVVTLNNIGIYGEYTAHFIDVHGDEDILFENLVHKDSATDDLVTNQSIVNKTLVNQINLWMGEISPGINVRTTAIPNSDNVLLEYVYTQPNFGSTNRYKPANVGFGISYVLPVVTALLASKPGQLLIIENPESHIHPRGQVELGKLISLVSKNDVQVIVETHSDHVLNGVRVAVKGNPELRKRICLFYFEKNVSQDEQYSKIHNIEIDKNGELSAYPKNLLDEWGNQMIKLV